MRVFDAHESDDHEHGYQGGDDEFFEILDELNMYPVDESSLEIVTIDGKTYHFGDDLSPREVEYFTRKLIEEIAKLKN